MTILKLFILTITIVHTIHLADLARSTQRGRHKSHHGDSKTPESETLIENKNVNVVVNVDPKEVATELWKIIEKEHPAMQQAVGARSYVNELEEIIKPYLTPTRRSEPSAYEVAVGLDFITRRALDNQTIELDAAEEESLTRKIVAGMMTKLKDIRNGKFKLLDIKNISASPSSSRRMLTEDIEKTSKTYSNDDDIDLLIRIRKGKVVDASLV